MGLLGIEPWGRALRAVSNHYTIFIFSIDSHQLELFHSILVRPPNLIFLDSIYLQEDHDL